MTTVFERRQTILRLLDEQPGIKVTQLAGMLDVSQGTIRNDLNALEEERKLIRVRGGATLVAEESSGESYLGRIRNAEAKRRIGRWAAEMVDDGDAIWLDAGTTAQMLIPFLAERRQLTVVTNGLRVALELAEKSSHTVLMIGGRVEATGIYTIGTANEHLLDNLRLRTAFISGVGFTLSSGLTVIEYEDARLKEKVLQLAERVVALVDSSKIGRPGFAPFASLRQLTHLVTDSELSPDVIDTLHEHDVSVTICGRSSVRSYAIDHSAPTFRIGFANLSEELPFAVDVRRGLERAAAARNNIDLIIADNKLSSAEALRVADHLIEREVDLAIEYQIDYRTGNLLMNKFQRADIPVIAVDIPIVGATFFGVDNYRAGYDGGVALGEWLRREWNGRYDYLLVLEEPRAGSLPAARIQGQIDGVSEVLGGIPQDRMLFLDSGNQVEVSRDNVLETLRDLPQAKRLPILTFNSDAALGAMQAARQARREEQVVIVGQGADRLLLEEIARPDTRVIGSTSYMPEAYGAELIELAVSILTNNPVPPAVYVEHLFLTREKITRLGLVPTPSS